MTERVRPVEFYWNGEAMIPVQRFKPLCARQFVSGEIYAMAPVENRSLKSNNHYFACLHEAWKNLAEEFDGRFPSFEHLRKWSLIQCGFATESAHVCSTPAEARKLATTFRQVDEYAVIVLRANVVRVFRAESQSAQAMKKERFQESKNAVLDLVATMSRTTPAQLRKEAARHVPPRREKEARP